MLTKSGKYRIFNIKTEPREIGIVNCPSDLLRGDWTYEPNPRELTLIERRHKEQGKVVVPFLYAQTYPTPEEALIEAEKWEETDSKAELRTHEFLKLF